MRTFKQIANPDVFRQGIDNLLEAADRIQDIEVLRELYKTALGQLKSSQEYVDPLMKFGNRRAFDSRGAEELEKAVRGGRTSVLMVLDVDRFKSVNDTYGHDAGDRVLRGVADVIRENARGGDIVARYGGEEIVLVAPGTLGQGKAFAERLRAAIAATPIETGVEGKPLLNVSVSIGVARSYPYEDVNALFKRADEALYRAKQEGRNCVRTAAFRKPEGNAPQAPAP